MKISYNWLKWYIPDAPNAKELADIITYHLTEVEGMEEREGDTIFDLNILPNRAHDLLSHQGVAKELSGQLGIKFNDPTEMYKLPPISVRGGQEGLKIEIKSPACRRYMGRIIRNVKVGPSPEWVVKHLESIGQRSINNIVDATNIVMYDCGQPCHAYDLNKVVSSKEQVVSIKIQNAREGEELPVVGRDGIVAKLKESDLVICNGDDTQLAIAGVKGGLDSGINENTTDIVLEVANFDPISVRKTARRLNLLSDSAKRFENDLSPEHTAYAMRELSALFLDPQMNCGDAVFEEIVDVYPNSQEGGFIQKQISFTTDFINKKLGSNITNEEIEKILQNYGYGYLNDFQNGKWTVNVPYMRLDLNISEDMVEEIGRIYGYEKIVGTLPQIESKPLSGSDMYSKILAVRSDLVEKGYREVMTYSFTNSGVVEVLASASDKNFLRTNLTDGVKKSYELNKLNAPLFGLDGKEVKIFEIGTVFNKNGEEINVCFADKKEIKEMSLENYSATLAIDEKKSSDLLSGSVLASSIGQTVFSSMPSFAEWSLFPFMTRDISVWVPENTNKEILKNIYIKNGTELLIREPQLVDTFTKDGKTSYAYRLIFQAKDRTLTDEEVGKIMENINTEIKSHNDWIVR